MPDKSSKELEELHDVKLTLGMLQGELVHEPATDLGRQLVENSEFQRGVDGGSTCQAKLELQGRDRFIAEQGDWERVVHGCEKILGCPDRSESPLQSNLPNLIRDKLEDIHHLKAEIERLKAENADLSRLAIYTDPSEDDDGGTHFYYKDAWEALEEKGCVELPAEVERLKEALLEVRMNTEHREACPAYNVAEAECLCRCSYIVDVIFAALRGEELAG